MWRHLGFPFPSRLAIAQGPRTGFMLDTRTNFFYELDYRVRQGRLPSLLTLVLHVIPLQVELFRNFARRNVGFKG